MTVARGTHATGHLSRPGSRRWTGALCLIPAAVLGLLTLPWLYRDCVGDPDTLLMLSGVLEHPARADQWNLSHKYGVLFSWGYYWLLYHLPAHVRERGSSLIAAVNAIGWGSAVLACGALGWLMMRIHGLADSLAVTIVVAFSPMVLELATYGHPFMLSASLLFGAGIVLMRQESLHGAAALAALALTGVLLFASFAVRADSVLALPWLALVSRPGAAAGGRIRRVAVRGLVFCAAFGAFMWFQRGIAGEHGLVLKSVGAFFKSFYNPEGLLRGAVVLVLASGLGLVLVGSALTLRPWPNPDPARSVVPPFVLFGVALVFWLPNPTPSRHFFFALIALAEMFGLAAVRQLGARRAVVLALAVVVVNQAGAELLYRPIAQTYWPEGSGARRMATGSVTLGASLPYHAAMRSVHGQLREEGRRLARVPDPEVVFLGDVDDYLVFALLERGGPRVWVETDEAGFWVTRIERAGQTFHIVRRSRLRPNIAAEYLAADPFPKAKIYVQPELRSTLAPIPPERLLTLPRAVE